ncbi:hypothetical protein [Paraferrimonas haliotis]|uniref:hypothetical protein n=1 Tax=Paraferrimonas haliotis TaxID=2013866 RepID=UPI000BA9CFC1|nr:hypothetical protein [Paraferrimonas haliotis]
MSAEILVVETTRELYTKHFSIHELRCGCNSCKKKKPHKIKRSALLALEKARIESGVVMPLSSAYRCTEHPKEARKQNPGQHNAGVAFDIRIRHSKERSKALFYLMNNGFWAVGSAMIFFHVDLRGSFAGWSYS